MKKLLLLLLLIPLMSIGQITLDDIFSIKDVQTFQRVMIENGFTEAEETEDESVRRVTIQYNKQEAEYLGWSLDNKYYLQAGASITSAAINLPLDRLYIKSENLKDAMNTQYETWQRLAMLAGYSKWNLGIEDGDKNKSSGGLNFDTINFGDSLNFDKIEF